MVRTVPTSSVLMLPLRSLLLLFNFICEKFKAFSQRKILSTDKNRLVCESQVPKFNNHQRWLVNFDIILNISSIP